MQSHDFVVPYLKAVLAFLGMTDITVIPAEGASLPGIQKTALETTINSISISETVGI